MAKNLVFKNDNKKNRVDDLGVTLAPGTPVVSSSGTPAVTITGSADYTVSEVIPGVGTLSGIAAGGASLVGTEVSLAFDGTWEFSEDIVDGATADDLADGTEIFITSSNELTITAAGNYQFGTVDFPAEYDKSRGMIPVKIGVR